MSFAVNGGCTQLWACAPVNLFRLDATNIWEITERLYQGRNITLCNTSFCAARLCSGPLRY